MDFVATHSFYPKDVAERKAKERKMNILLLIQLYLKSEGYIETFHQLVNESKFPKDFKICDNIDLNNILQDYESYYFLRFQKYPKISKKVETSETPEKKAIAKPKKPVVKEQKKEQLTDKSDFPISSVLSIHPFGQGMSQEEDTFEKRLFKPLGSFQGYSDEWKSLAEMISRDILEKNLNVKWEDVVGLKEAKALLKEAIVYPMKYPELYQDAIAPWKGLLLFGPSGTGKTLLAKAVASECNTTFFNISASSIVSKWRGDSEKLVRVMFDLARLEAPSTIFVDELDAIASRRDSTFEHEASRRLKSELLVQLDGLCESSGNIFFLTTSNLPWDLDSAILRRLEKKIFVGLPDFQDCENLIRMYLPPTIMAVPLLSSKIDYSYVAECDGYSGADIKLLCKEVKMAAVRQMFVELEEKEINCPDFEKFNYMEYCHVAYQFKGKTISQLKLKPISNDDFIDAKKKVKSSVNSSFERYRQWSNEFGT